MLLLFHYCYYYTKLFIFYQLIDSIIYLFIYLFIYFKVIGCLFALKVLHPTQVFLIRGNHEFTEQNGKIENKHSFIRQCYSAYGHGMSCE